MRFINIYSIIFLLLFCKIPHLLSQSEVKINYGFNKVLLTDALNELIYTHHVPLLYLKSQAESILVTEQCSKCAQEEAINKLLKHSGLKIKKTNSQFILYNPQQEGLNSATGLEREMGIKGIVLDSITSEPLPYATIVIERTNKGLSTDAQGMFNINNLAPGLYKLKIVYMGYATDSIIADLRKPQNGRFYQVKLATKSHELNEVEVNTAIPVKIAVTSGMLISTIDPKRLKTIPTLDQGDIVQNIKLIPGVSAMPDNLGGFNLRGGAVDQTLMQVDGIPLFHSVHLWGFNSSLNADAIESVSIHSGGFSAQYGDRLSGVIDIKGRSAGNDKVHGGMFANLFATKAYIATPITNRANLFLSLNRSANLFGVNDKILDRNDYMFFNLYQGAAIVKSEEDIVGMGTIIPYQQKRTSKYYDIYGKVNLQISNTDSLSISFIANNDQIAIHSNIDNKYGGIDIAAGRIEQWKTSGLSVNHAHYWNKRFKTNFGAIYSDYTNNANFTYAPDTTFSVYKNGLNLNTNYIKQIQFLANSQILLPNYSFVAFGLEYNKIESGFERFSVNGLEFYSFTTDTLKTFSNIVGNEEINGFAEATLNPLKRLTLIFGTRLTYNLNTALFIAEPRVNTTIDIGKGFLAQASWGTFHQNFHCAPSGIAYNVSSFGSTNVWILAQIGLNPMHSQHWQVGIRYDHKKVSIHLSAYKKTYTDLAFIIPTIMEISNIDSLDGSEINGKYKGWLNNRKLLPSNHDSVVYTLNPLYASTKDIDYFTGSGYSKGIELFVSKNSGLYTGFISYNLSYTRYKFPYINMGNEFTADYDRTHEFKILNSLQWRGWNLGCLYTIATGKPYPGEFKVNNYYSDSHLVLEHPLKWNLSNTRRTPTYQSVDISISKKLNLFNLCKLLTGASVYNVFNHENVLSRYNSLSTNPDRNNMAIIKPQLFDHKGPERLFNVFVNIEF